MGKKPFLLMAFGIFVIVGAFVFGVEDPKCGSGRGAPSMSPGQVCELPSGEEQTYDEAKAEQNREIRIGLPIFGGVVVLYGGYTLVTRLRNPDWRAAGKRSPAAVPPGH